eukprot:tig00021319_g20229.t1
MEGPSGNSQYSASTYADEGDTYIRSAGSDVGSQLSQREVELRRLNEQLEAKKQSAMRQAEAALRDQEEKLARGATPQGPMRPMSAASSADAPPSPIRVAAPRPGSSSRPPTSSTARPRSGRERDVMASVLASASTEFEPQPRGSSPLRDAAADVDSDGLGPEAAVRLLKAKVAVLQQELDRALSEIKQRDATFAETSKTLAEIAEERQKLLKANAALEAVAEKSKRAAEEAQKKNELLERQLMVTKKDLDTAQRIQKTLESESGNREVRLNRALEDVEKLKGQLKEARSQGRETSDSVRKALEKAQQDAKRLERQKAELLLAFKKQLKLIDVLKRQKVHIEAARLLAFTEEEFTRTLELGERM